MDVPMREIAQQEERPGASACTSAAASASAASGGGASGVTAANGACTICLQPLSMQASCTLDCGHAFHAKCVVEWFRRVPTCPLCREEGDCRLSAVGVLTIQEQAHRAMRQSRAKGAPAHLKRGAAMMRQAKSRWLDAKRAHRALKRSQAYRDLSKEETRLWHRMNRARAALDRQMVRLAVATAKQGTRFHVGHEVRMHMNSSSEEEEEQGALFVFGGEGEEDDEEGGGGSSSSEEEGGGSTPEGP